MHTGVPGWLVEIVAMASGFSSAFTERQLYAPAALCTLRPHESGASAHPQPPRRRTAVASCRLLRVDRNSSGLRKSVDPMKICLLKP